MRVPTGESFIDPKSVYFTFRKHLSPEALAKKVAKVFASAADPRDRRRVQISLTDALMSAFAMFTLKVPSLLAFDALRANAGREKNLANLFGIENIPSDTTMREILDAVDPEDIRPAFKDVFFELQRAKALESYEFMDGYYLVAIDGTGYFSSNSVHCDSCLEKHSKSGEVTYQHQMLGAVLIHPEKKQVIPLCPEPIVKQDGSSKNDCERNACRRILEKIREDHPRLKIMITEDGLSSNAPHIRDLVKYGMSFILGAKPGDHKFLFEEFDLAGDRCKQVRVRGEKGVVHFFRYVNGLQLNESSEDVVVNFLDYSEVHPSGKEIKFSWVTDKEITDQNVYQIMRGGRARWKIENETFNTLKNQGYEFEHNYGHGYKNLSTVLAYLMMLAFLVDQAQLASNKLVQAALQKVKRLKELYRTLRNYFDIFVFQNWQELYSAIALGIDATFTIRFPTKNTS